MSVRSPSNVQPPLSTPSYQPVTQSKTQGGYVSKVREIMGTSLSAGPQGSPGILRKNSITDSLTEPASNWRVDELLNFADLAEDCNAANMGSSKVLCCNLWCCCKLLMPWIFCCFYTVNQQQELLLLDFWWHNLAFRVVYCNVWTQMLCNLCISLCGNCLTDLSKRTFMMMKCVFWFLQADVATFGDFDWTADFSIFDEDSFHEVPKLPSPPTGSGLSRSTRMIGPIKNMKQEVALVPDFGDAFTVPDLHLDKSPPPSPPLGKRRRNYYDI